MKEPLKRIGLLLRRVLPLLVRTGRRPVLFVRQGAMGDILCTFPAALELKKRHPGAAFIYSCGPDFAALPAMAGVTDYVTAAHIAPESRWKFLFAAVYHFEYGDERPDTGSSQTIIAEFCRQHGVPATDAHPRLQPDSVTGSRVEKRLADRGVAGPFAVIHCGPSWPVREWPAAAWTALVQELKAHGLAHVVQLGSSRHVQMGESADNTVPGTVSFVDELSLAESFALLSRARLLVGIDSGLLHAAACLRTPAVGLFGPTSPQFRFARDSSCAFVLGRVECQGCHHRRPRLHWMTGCPHEIKCMREIPVGEVLAAGLSQLKQGQGDTQ